MGKEAGPVKLDICTWWESAESDGGRMRRTIRAMVYRQIIPRPVQFIKDRQSSIQVILFSSASNTSERCPRGRMGMGKPETRMADIQLLGCWD